MLDQVNQKITVPAYIFMGGTFDPVHCGHIEGALSVSQLFDDNLVHLLPTKIPVHKQIPSTSVAQRIAMLKLATEKYEAVTLDLREVEAATQSFTIESLKQLRCELGTKRPLIMVIGMDSFLTLPKWRDSDQFMQLCHIVVLQRPNYQQNKLAHDNLYFENIVESVDALKSSSAGKIFFLAQPPIDISASEIRRQITNSKTPNLLPVKVADYINRHHLYQEM